MKTTVLTTTLFFTILSKYNAQTTFYPSVKWRPAVPANNSNGSQNSNSTSNSNSNQGNQIRETSIYREVIKSPKTENRVTAYYEDGYRTNATWKHFSIKVEITTNNIGKEEITVIAYLSESGYWSTVGYGSVTKTYGEIAKEFSYQAYVNGRTVYFNI